MGLLRSYEDGTQTDLRSLRFGRDRRGGGSSNEPYLYNPIFAADSKALEFINNSGDILNRINPITSFLQAGNIVNIPNFNLPGVKPGNILEPPPIGANSDLIIRGGAVLAAIRSADDIRRMARRFFDTKNVSGKLFRVKQLALSRTAPKTQQSKRLFNGGTYSPLQTLLQVGGNAIGLHLDKQGPLLSQLPRYADIMVDFVGGSSGAGESSPIEAESNGQVDNVAAAEEEGETSIIREGKTSRLAGLFYRFTQGEKKKPKSLKNFRVKRENNTFLYSYTGGPGSLLGFGRTRINLATDRNQVPIKLDPLTKNSFFSIDADNTNIGGRDYLTNGATFRLRFLWKRQFNTKEWPTDPSFYTGAYVFNLATKADNNTPLRTLPPSLTTFDENIASPYTIQSKYLSTSKEALSTITQLYMADLDPNSLPLSTFIFHEKKYRFGTKPFTDAAIRTKRKKTEETQQWSQGDINTREGKFNKNYQNGSPLNSELIPTVAPEINEDFRKKISFYQDKLSYNNPKTLIDSRINQGTPGGADSKSAYKSGKITRFSDSSLTFPNNFKGLSPEQLAKATDKLNALPVYQSSALKLKKDVANNDLVHFAIGIVRNDSVFVANYLHFRAFLNDITDNYSSDWDSHSYVGRAEKFYNYTGNFERDISLSFMVVAQSKAELIPMYKKLNYLASSIAGDYTPQGYMAGNFMKLTIGGYVYEMPGFLKGITYTMKQGYPWEIQITDTVDADGNMLYDNSVKELCHYIEVTGFNFQVVHNFLPRIANDDPMNTKRRFISLRDGGGTNWTSTGALTGLEEGLGLDGDIDFGSEVTETESEVIEESSNTEETNISESTSSQNDGDVDQNFNETLVEGVENRTNDIIQGEIRVGSTIRLDLDGEGVFEEFVVQEKNGNLVIEIAPGVFSDPSFFTDEVLDDVVIKPNERVSETIDLTGVETEVESFEGLDTDNAPPAPKPIIVSGVREAEKYRDFREKL